ncbi:hypothetical protein PV326_008115 [Microctonus aethiopoides]|nr:hypothetical protein PV326_008115 [Microctonus aethiopoides]
MSPALVAILNSSVTFLSANWSLERKTTPQWWYLIIANVGQSHSGVGTNTYGFAVGYEHPMTSEESDRCAQLPPVHRDKNVGLKGLPDLVLPIDSLLFQGYGMFLYVIQSNMFRARPNPFLLTQESICLHGLGGSLQEITLKGSQPNPCLLLASPWPPDHCCIVFQRFDRLNLVSSCKDHGRRLVRVYGQLRSVTPSFQ